MSRQHRLFTDRELRNLGRCLACEMHPKYQGHAADCPIKDRKTTKR